MDSHLIVICEECGKKYRVDADKILGQVAGFSCRACGHRIRVARPETNTDDRRDDSVEQRPAPELAQDAGLAAQPEPPARRPGISLQAKALLLLFIVPAGIAAAAGYLFLDQAEELVSPGQREPFFMLLLLWGGVVLCALAAGLWFGLKLTGKIRRLAEAAERIVAGPPAPGDGLDRIEAALARLREIVHSQGAGK